MPADNRDRDIIEHILRYCEQIETAHFDFDQSRQRFDESTTYQNAICMCILQIGELVGHCCHRTGLGLWHRINYGCAELYASVAEVHLWRIRDCSLGADCHSAEHVSDVSGILHKSIFKT